MSSDSPVEDPLAGLVEAARAGGDEAFERLARRVLPDVRRWALVRTGDPDDADEVAQQVLIRVYRGLSSFRGDARFSSWLYRITARAATDLHRKRAARARKRSALEMEAAAMRNDSPAPSEGLEARRAAERVRHFFRELSDTQRQVFDLVDLQGFRPAEAAELIEMNPKTLRVHLHRARRAIRRALVQTDPALAKEYGP